jgi:protein subunit release factor A
MSIDTVHEPVLRKREELRARYEAITEEMNRPEVASDPNRIVALAKEHGQLKRMIDPYNRYLFASFKGQRPVSTASLATSGVSPGS